MPHDKTEKKIRFELEQIDKLLKMYESLIDKSRTEKVDSVELAASASVIHSFYNGVENIFKLIAKNVDDSLPIGSNWHKKVLTQMNDQTESRGKVISDELLDDILRYLAFRHFYRHSYSFVLDWKEMEGLIVDLPDVQNRFKKEIERFLDDNSQ